MTAKRRKHTNRILLVTRDEQAVRYLADEVFQGSFWSFAVAPPQAHDLAARIQRDDPDLVLYFMDEEPGAALLVISHIMLQCPVPVLLMTAAPDHKKSLILKCLEIGAVDVVSIPPRAQGVSREHRLRLIRTIDAARHVRVRPITLPRALDCISLDGYQDEEYYRARERLKQELVARRSRDAIGIAISTGGPQTLGSFLPLLPEALPVPIFVVQHIIKGFIDNIARRLDAQCAMTVKLADHGEPAKPGVIYLAPDARHLTVKREQGRPVVHLSETPEGLLFRPSADVLFQSMAETYGARCIGAIMTGMGQDGVAGMRALNDRGAFTIAQDRRTSVIYGMARVAVEQRLIQCIAPLDKMCVTLTDAVFSPAPARKKETAQTRS
jgi:two-component system chemotaxis response regulator CheB